jgi:excisionase family DNA binding protein
MVIHRLEERGYPASKPYVYKLIDMGELKSVRIGKRKGIRVREDWLDQYISEKANKFSILST